MHPVLFHLEAFGYQWTPHLYGLCIAAGFLLGIFVAIRTARRLGEDADELRDLCFWLIVASLAGARLLYLLTNLDELAADPLSVLRVWQTGLVFYGGFFGALVTAVYYTRRYAMSFWRTADLLAPSVALGHFFGRLGCFFAGCCYGRPTSSWLGVRFLGHAEPLHPTQLYEAGFNLVLFWSLTVLGRRKRCDGQVLAAYLVAYAALRFVVEFFRGDTVRGFVLFGLSTSQALALFAAALGAGLWLVRRRRVSVAA